MGGSCQTSLSRFHRIRQLNLVNIERDFGLTVERERSKVLTHRRVPARGGAREIVARELFGLAPRSDSEVHRSRSGRPPRVNARAAGANPRERTTDSRRIEGQAPARVLRTSFQERWGHERRHFRNPAPSRVRNLRRCIFRGHRPICSTRRDPLREEPVPASRRQNETPLIDREVGCVG